MFRKISGPPFKSTLLLLGYLFFSGSAHAECEPFVASSEEIWGQLQDHIESVCFKASIASWKKEKLKAEGNENINSAKLVAGWIEVRSQLEDVRNSMSSVSTGYIDQIADRVNLAERELRKDQSEFLFVLQGPWEINWREGALPAVDLESTTVAQNSIDLKSNLTSACSSEAGNDNSPCPAMSANADALMFVLLLARDLGAKAGEPIVKKLATEIAAVDSQWDQFLLGGKPMYWLDLVATNWFSDRAESSGGFRRPPEYQFYFLHPSPALSYIEDAPDGEQLTPSIYLEIIGFNKWRSKGFSAGPPGAW